jgi:hypothetical protein
MGRCVQLIKQDLLEKQSHRQAFAANKKQAIIHKSAHYPYIEKYIAEK